MHRHLKNASRWAVVVLVTVGAAEQMTGCAPAPRDAFDRAVALYDAGDYEAAARASERLMTANGSRMRVDAAYLSGISASQLGRLDEAERYLLIAATADDPTTAANAAGALGLVRLRQNRPGDAAAYFGEAADRLSAGDARTAARYAAAACAETGDGAAALRWRSQASGDATGFAIQVGAFKERRRAVGAATSASAEADRLGRGGTRIVPRVDDDGATLYIVQFGRFATRALAEEARGRIGAAGYIVTTAAVQR